MHQPTREQMEAFVGLFDHFNARLFEGSLPPLVLNFSRHAGSMGFFSFKRWSRTNAAGGLDHTHEISLNPDELHQGPLEAAQTLVHEMAHYWQYIHGTPARRGYHDHEWSAKMEAIGLMPSATGKPGGKRVGPKMNDYAITGGRFLKAFGELTPAQLLPWCSGGFAPSSAAVNAQLAAAIAGVAGELESGEGEGSGGTAPVRLPKPKDPSKLKYTCATCGVNVWGKSGLKLVCGEDNAPFECVA